MREFLLASCPVAIWVIFALEVLIFVLLRKAYKAHKKAVILFSSLITLGLCIDALGISLGSLISGTPLLVISRIRFISHGVLIPLLFPICVYALDLSKKWKKAVLILAAVLMIAGLAEAIATKLELATIANVTRYKSSDDTPAWASAISSILSFGTVIPLMIAGIFVWIRQKTPFLFLSGFFMFAFSALGPATGNADLIFYVSMYGELLMVLFLYLYAKNLNKRIDRRKI